MAIGYGIETLLSAGNTAGLTTEIYDGKLPQQGNYPAVQITDFSTSIPCKEGEAGEDFTVTTIVWATTKYECDQILDAIKSDLIRAKLHASFIKIRDISFQGRGPWLRDDEKKYWGRPGDFKVMV